MKMFPRMRRPEFLTAVLILSACSRPWSRPASEGVSKKLIHHAHVFSHPASDAVLVSGSRIAEVGRTVDLRARCGESCELLDAKGGFLMPGFHDSHAHLYEGGMRVDEFHLSSTKAEEIQRELKTYVERHPEKSWIYGGTWSALDPRAGTFSKRVLDSAESVRPVVLVDASGHNFWVNSAALRAAGIDGHSRDPAGGRIIRDQEGVPTGVLYEAATYAVRAVSPKPSDEEIRESIRKGQDLSLRNGFTSVQGGPIPLTLELARIYAEMDRDGELKQRTFLWGSLSAPEREFLELAAFARSLPEAGRLRISAFKGFVDGVTGSRTAAMHEAYPGDPKNFGILKYSSEKLGSAVLRANRAGFPVLLHAIGDRGVSVALDAFEFSRNRLGHSLLNRVEHVSMLRTTDVPRFRDLGVIASVQPGFLYYRSAETFGPKLSYGRARAEAEAFRWKDLLDAGATVIFGTDFPDAGNFGPDPVNGLHCAIQRQLVDGSVFTPSQRLSGEASVLSYTSLPAMAVGMGSRIGKLLPGMEADLVLLDHDPVDGKARTLAENPVRMVFVGGIRYK